MQKVEDTAPTGLNNFMVSSDSFTAFFMQIKGKCSAGYLRTGTPGDHEDDMARNR